MSIHAKRIVNEGSTGQRGGGEWVLAGLTPVYEKAKGGGLLRRGGAVKRWWSADLPITLIALLALPATHKFSSVRNSIPRRIPCWPKCRSSTRAKGWYRKRN